MAHERDEQKSATPKSVTVGDSYIPKGIPVPGKEQANTQPKVAPPTDTSAPPPPSKDD